MSVQTSISEYFGARKRGPPEELRKKVTAPHKVLILDKNSVISGENSVVDGKPCRQPHRQDADTPSAARIVYKESPPTSANKSASSAPKRSRKTPLVAVRRSSTSKKADGRTDPSQPDIRKCLFPAKPVKTEEPDEQIEEPATSTSPAEVTGAPPPVEVVAALTAVEVIVAPPAVEVVAAPPAVEVVAAPPAVKVIAAPPAVEVTSAAPTVAPSTPVKTEKIETADALPEEPEPAVLLTPKKEEKVDKEHREPTASKKQNDKTALRAESLQKSGKLADLKNRLKRFNEGFGKYKEIQERNEKLASSPSAKKPLDGLREQLKELRERKLTSSPKIKEFSTIELEVQVSPKKKTEVVEDIRTASSPSLLRKALFMSPTKLPPGATPYVSPRKLFEKPPPASPTKPAYQRLAALKSAAEGKPALPLPSKYRCLAETFRSVDRVVMVMYNRNENIIFSKLKSSVQNLTKRNFTEAHIAQIMTVLPDAFTLKREKVRTLGNQKEEYELVLLPVIPDEPSGNNEDKGNKEKMTPNLLNKRQREFYNALLEKVEDHHEVFLRNLDPPIVIAREKLTRWHPDFDVDSACPDIPAAPLPSPPVEKLSTAKDVLGKVKDMFSTNNRMERVLESMSNKQPPPPKSETAAATAALSKALKGIPKSLLEKVRAKQAAKTAALLTRCPEETKRRLELTRLPELARILRNIFVLERKNVLPQAVVIEKVNQSFREVLSQDDLIRHFGLLKDSVPGWMTEILDGDKKYLRVARDADFARVTNRLNQLIDHNRVNL